MTAAETSTQSDLGHWDSILKLTVSVEAVRWIFYNLFFTALYAGTLAYSYIHAVSPINASSWNFYLDINSSKVLESVFWGLLTLPTINNRWQRPSDFGLSLLYYLALVPTLIIFGLANQSRSALYVMLISYMLVYGFCRYPIAIPRLDLGPAKRSAAFLAVTGSLAILAVFLARGNRANFNTDLFAVYDYRDAASSVFSGGILPYLAGWVPRVLTPFAICYFFFRRQWIAFALAYGFQLASLVIFQEKSVFIPCLLLPMLYFGGRGRMGQATLILWLVATLVACEFAWEHYNFSIPVQLWTRRFFFDQQFGYFLYFEVFGKLGQVQLSDNFFSAFIHYPFPYPPGAMIEYYFTGQIFSNYNTGFFGAGYMEFGAVGVFISGAISGFILRLFDSLTDPKLPMWFFGTTALSALMAMLITENTFTSILSGGVAPLLILMACAQDIASGKPAQT